MSWLAKIFHLNFGPDWSRVDWTKLDASWQSASTLWASGEQSQKKQAIIQADSSFDQALKQAGVSGGSMGERIKNIRGLLDYPLYNRLWEAHKKRNELVHEADSFVAHWDRADYLATYKQVARQLRFGR